MPAPTSIAANWTSSRSSGGMERKLETRAPQWAQRSVNNARSCETTIIDSYALKSKSADPQFGQLIKGFMKIYSDDEARQELRKITVTDYVNLNELPVTQFQDEGWDPVELYR